MTVFAIAVNRLLEVWGVSFVFFCRQKINLSLKEAYVAASTLVNSIECFALLTNLAKLQCLFGKI